MGLINLLTNLNTFYADNPFHQQYPGNSAYSTPPAAIARGSFIQKSLPYGDDRPNQGSSNQPYIQTEIPEGREINSFDFLLRNGTLTLRDTANDVSRITKFFFDTKSAQGTLFISKQLLLERQNPKIPSQNRIYNPLNTILQTGVSAFGGHLNKQGLFPFQESYYTGGTSGYFKLANDAEDGNYGRLTTLAYYKMGDATGFSDASLVTGKTLWGIYGSANSYAGTIGPRRLRSRERRGKGNADRNVMLKYSGGASTLGLFGNTWIKTPVDSLTPIKSPWTTTSQRTIATIISDPNAPNKTTIKIVKGADQYQATVASYFSNMFTLWQGSLAGTGVAILTDNGAGNIFVTFNSPTSFVPYYNLSTKAINSQAPNSTYVFTYGQIMSQTSVEGNSHKNGISNKITDFRATIAKDVGTDEMVFANYENDNRETTYRTSVTTYKGNYRNGRRITNPNLAISSDQTEGGVLGEDIIDFNITCLSNEGNNVLLDFKAYVTDLSDGYNGDWDSFKYTGRGETFYKYKGYTRDINLKFSVVALSRADMIYNYRKLNYLVSTLTPDYSKQGFMRGNIQRLTLGHYLTGVPGIIKTCNLESVFEAGWDINRSYADLQYLKVPTDKANPGEFVGQLPKLINVSLTFTPIHSFLPKLGEAFIGVRNLHNGTQVNNKPIILYTDEDGNTISSNNVGSGVSTVRGVGLTQDSPLLREQTYDLSNLGDNEGDIDQAFAPTILPIGNNVASILDNNFV